MKLSKIYSDKNFKNIQFSSGFNVIIAEIKDASQKKDTHGLGKTSLIDVINFILLCSFAKVKHILGKPIFENQNFYGEILLNSGKYLTIKRGTDKPTKISFKLANISVEDFKPPVVFDEEDLPLKKARHYLNAALNFNILPDWNYRKSITYYLRSQQDYTDEFKLNKYKRKDRDWKPFVFDLLGSDGKLLIDKADTEEEIEGYKNNMATLKREANIDIDERDKLVGLIDIKTEEKNNLGAQIDRFNFYNHDKNLNEELITDIDNKIQSLSTQRYSHRYEIEKINKSLASQHVEISVEDLEKLFKEAQIFFEGQIKKDYSELIQFNEAISAERTTYLKQTLESLQIELVEIERRLRDLEKDKEEALALLTEKDTYTKFKKYQKELSKAEAEISRMTEKLSLIDKSSEYREKIEKNQEKLKIITKQIHEEINKRHHAKINRIFNSIITEVLNTNALISLKQNKEGNVEFSANYQNPVDFIETSEGRGNTYKRLLCIAFDLAILIYYSDDSFYRFVYHDGALEGLDRRKKLALIKVVKRICAEYGLQYIMTLIDSDLPLVEGEPFQFSPEEICLKLHDKDDSGKLFLSSF